MIASLLKDFDHAGVRLCLDGERLKVRAASPDLYTPDMRQVVADNKPAIVEFLKVSASGNLHPPDPAVPEESRAPAGPAEPAKQASVKG